MPLAAVSSDPEEMLGHGHPLEPELTFPLSPPAGGGGALLAHTWAPEASSLGNSAGTAQPGPGAAGDADAGAGEVGGSWCLLGACQ